jgi:hypothetical protein
VSKIASLSVKTGRKAFSPGFSSGLPMLSRLVVRMQRPEVQVFGIGLVERHYPTTTAFAHVAAGRECGMYGVTASYTVLPFASIWNGWMIMQGIGRGEGLRK